MDRWQQQLVCELLGKSQNTIFTITNETSIKFFENNSTITKNGKTYTKVSESKTHDIYAVLNEDDEGIEITDDRIEIKK